MSRKEWNNYLHEVYGDELTEPMIKILLSDLIKKYGIDGLDNYKKDLDKSANNFSGIMKKYNLSFKKITESSIKLFDWLTWNSFVKKNVSKNKSDYNKYLKSEYLKQLKQKMKKGIITEEKYIKLRDQINQISDTLLNDEKEFKNFIKEIEINS